MSDREKGLSSAVAHVLPEVPHGYCCFHIKKNTKTECKTDFNGKITKLAKVTTSTEYARLMDECEDENAAAAEYLKGRGVACTVSRVSTVAAVAESLPIAGMRCVSYEYRVA
ncbi:hypothetical protein PHYSODRAFT_328074 [Phytophthora sojae]|uniref:MULE transposase domain-containing protein n=1 Tax=Phytophthora sojae (strain P6497) TaxID=1094619 RepID=G4ZBI2_PHYSP|nr:hypothetical protein PHYSODRAFT_328074 [Phytophthora sojae]EGZ19904.1 hypothetical protein PHYSODRAFT_328074 [Phytophthora sojae]|eukprot:XP_009522621.1 hypothetical protein PHYSODRAFT_328074 [Phytophthora sojae]